MPMSDEWRELGCGTTGGAAIEHARATLVAEGHDVPDEEFRVRYDTDDGGHFTASVRAGPGKTRVERLTLVSEVEWLHFDPAVLLQPGEVFWTYGRTLHVMAKGGAVRRVHARSARPDDSR